MTREELRLHPEYQKCMDKIKSYRTGFRFTVHFSSIPKAQANALVITLHDACEKGFLECVEIGHGWNNQNEFTILERTYRRTEVQA